MKKRAALKKGDASEGTMKTKEAAEHTGLSEAFIKKLIGAKRLQTTKVGKARLIFKSSLTRLLEEGRDK